jgi:hypothetical protein
MKESQKIKINGIVRYQARYLDYVQVEDHSFLRLSVSTTSIELHDSAKITFVVCVIHAQLQVYILLDFSVLLTDFRPV